MSRMQALAKVASGVDDIVEGTKGLVAAGAGKELLKLAEALRKAAAAAEHAAAELGKVFSRN